MHNKPIELIDQSFYHFENIIFDQGKWILLSNDGFIKNIVSGMNGAINITIESTKEKDFVKKYSEVEVIQEPVILHARHVMAGLSHMLFDELLSLFYIHKHFKLTNPKILQIINHQRKFDESQFCFTWNDWLVTMLKMPVFETDSVKRPVLIKNLYFGWYPSNKFLNQNLINFQEFRQYIIDNLAIKENHIKSEKITFINRQNKNKHSRRYIENNKEIENYLSSLPNVQFISPENFGIRKQIEIAISTKIFIAVHGAAMTLAFFMKPNSHVIEIMPYGFVYESFKNYIEKIDVNYNILEIDKSNFNEFAVDKILKHKQIDISAQKYIQLLKDSNLLFGSHCYPLGLNQNDVKPIYRDQNITVNIESLKNKLKNIIC